MFGFLFKDKKEKENNFDINTIYSKLKEIYSYDEISDERKNYLKDKNGAEIKNTRFNGGFQ